MSDKTASVFLVTRPFQYFNVINIPCVDIARTLLIVNSFKGAQSLKEKAELPDSRWVEVQMFDSVNGALVWVRKHKEKFTDFFTFSDFGLRLCLMLGQLRPLRIHLYEEGRATYARDELWPGSVRFFASILSSGKIKLYRHMGECRFVDTIFVNHVELYKTLFPDNQKIVCGFSTPLLENLIANSDDPGIRRFCADDAANRDALLYLSDWTINKAVFNVIAVHPLHMSIAKFHPAYLIPETFETEFDLVLKPEILAEIVIAELVKYFRTVTVVHECSSAVLNCRLAGLSFEEINIGSSMRGEKLRFEIIQGAIEKLMAKAQNTKSESITID